MFYQCVHCNETFTRKSSLTRHQLEFHLGQPVKQYTHKHTHLDTCTTLPKVTKNDITRIISKTAFNNAVRYIRFFSETEYMHCEFFDQMLPLLQETIDCLKEETVSLKINTTLCLKFTKVSDDSITVDSYFSTNAQTLEQFDIKTVFAELDSKIASYTQRGSNWNISNTLFFEMIVSIYKKKF